MKSQMKGNFVVRVLSIYIIIFSLTGCLKKVDENPIVTTDKLVGEYSNYEQVLIIEADKTYRISTSTSNENGSWFITDSTVTLTTSNKRITRLKVYEVDGFYELITLERNPQDPDSYDWSRIMKRKVVE